MARLNLDRLKKKGKTEERPAKRARLELGAGSGVKDPGPGQTTVPPTGSQVQPEAGAGLTAQAGVSGEFISLTEDLQHAWRNVLGWMSDEEIAHHDNLSGFQLVKQLTFDAVKTLTRSYVTANRLMLAEKHMAEDEQKIKGMTGEVEESKQRLQTALLERDGARAAEEALREELAELKKKHAAEKVALVSKTIEDYKCSEAFQLELEECFNQAFEVARERATLLFPGQDFSTLQPVDQEQTSEKTTGTAEDKTGENQS